MGRTKETVTVWVGVLLVYAGLLGLFVGLVSLVKPLRFLRIKDRRAAAGVLALAVVSGLVGAALPAPLLRPVGKRVLLDDFSPAFQFYEAHETRVHAAPDRIFRAVREVTASEIRFFRTLTWIRSPRFGSGGGEDILNAPAEKPILDVALKSGFVLLADDPGREIVFGTLIGRRTTGLRSREPQDYAAFDRPGYAKAVMNFHVEEAGGGFSTLSTETRVYATDDAARRNFALYWRLIYPGSALIRVMWLEAVKKRAEAAA